MMRIRIRNTVSYNGLYYEINLFMAFINLYIQFQILTWIRIRNLELRIRFRQKFRILTDPDPQHWFPQYKPRSRMQMMFVMQAGVPVWRGLWCPSGHGPFLQWAGVWSASSSAERQYQTAHLSGATLCQTLQHHQRSCTSPRWTIIFLSTGGGVGGGFFPLVATVVLQLWIPVIGRGAYLDGYPVLELKRQFSCLQLKPCTGT
jgi:hypothetical protein